LTNKDVHNRFDLLEDADDLSIDAPNAKSMVGKFLARSVFDEIQPSFYQHLHSMHKEYDVRARWANYQLTINNAQLTAINN